MSKNFVDKNGVPEAYIDSVYFQVPKEQEARIKEILLKENIPNKSFDHPEKVYFEAKAEVLLRANLSGKLPEDEQYKMFQASLDNREEYGKLLFDEMWQTPAHDESKMNARVQERMRLDNFLKKLNDNK